MSNSNKIRTWINKNDGKYFQVENQAFNSYEATGFISLILAFVVYLFHDKTGFEATWLAWLFLGIGCTTLIVGVLRKVKNRKYT